MRFGIIGGSFDPIHLGHLLIAEEARVRLDLAEVAFIPAGQPWMKQDTPMSPAHHRLNMVRLAISSNPFFTASSCEMDREGPTYTVDTLEELHQDDGGHRDLYFILGVDALQQLHLWKDPGRILELCTLVAAPRPGGDPIDLRFLEDIGPAAKERLVLLERPLVDISATEIRRRASSGLSIQYMVSEQVERYIHRYHLYTEGDGEG
jgi:nicotinate-nucleotide adenylyltransferase